MAGTFLTRKLYLYTTEDEAVDEIYVWDGDEGPSREAVRPDDLARDCRRTHGYRRPKRGTKEPRGKHAKRGGVREFATSEADQD